MCGFLRLFRVSLTAGPMPTLIFVPMLSIMPLTANAAH
jgi:hypothetical protein